MSSELERRWSELAPLLDATFELTGPQREQWFARQSIDPELQNLLRRMLDSDARVGDELEQDMDRLRDAVTETVSEGGDEATVNTPQIAGYRVLHWLGSGGMASVFLAERTLDGTNFPVALKLLRLNVHDPRERRLFQREQAALGRLQHPHIAHLIDAGFAADGAPWLAMEYVDGDTLLRYCDQRRLDLRARVRLFLDVCAAVAAAHHALVVHRDLKPGNVLVRSDGAVKLVDFGIAKLLESDDEATRTELRRLTPGYAAPEQYRGEEHGTASDIYALGVILTELLCGSRPIARRDGTMPGLSTLPVDSAAASARNDDVRSLRRSLRGDLDAMVARALRPEPRERYVSVDALATDLGAWLEHRPVSARRGSRRYRMGKFLRRQRVGLALAASFTAALLLFSITSLNLARNAQIAAEEARNEALRAQHVQDFVLGMFRGEENGLAHGKANSAEDLIARALTTARREFAEQPDALIPLLTALGEIERSLGHLDLSGEVLSDAIKEARARFGDADARTLTAEAELAHTRFRAGNYIDAEAQLKRAYDAYRAAGGPDNGATVATLTRLTMLAAQCDKAELALDYSRTGMSIAERVFSPTHPQRLSLTAIYGDALTRNGDFVTATRVLSENLAATQQTYGVDHIISASALESLAATYLADDRPVQALALFEKAGNGAANSVPEANVTSAYMQNTWGVSLLRLGRSDEAQTHFEHALDLFHKLQGEKHPQLAATLDNLGAAALEGGDLPLALARWTEGSTMAHALGDDQRFRAGALDCQRGFVLSLLARHDAAKQSLEQGATGVLDALDDSLATCDAFAAYAASVRRDWSGAATFADAFEAAEARAPMAGTHPLLVHAARVHSAAQRGDQAGCEVGLQAALTHYHALRWPHLAQRLWQEMATDADTCKLTGLAGTARERAAKVLTELN
ncbi:MAG: serine/threonine-protein kinase [Tahibacter sp.]